MSLPVILQPGASWDAEEARDHFEKIRPGFGQALLNRLSQALAAIASMGEMFGVVWNRLRAARLRQFPYVIYYRVHDDHVEIIAMLHGKCDPSTWQNRA
jgi:plasmid stabilization system protein ParE